jgi:hypothetical protein
LYAQRHQVSPTVVIEPADRLSYTLEKIIGQFGTFPKKLGRVDSSKVEQSLPKVEQHGFDSLIWHNLCLEH